MRRATITVDCLAAMAAGENRHPGVIVRLFAHQLGFQIINQEARNVFEIETEKETIPSLPAWIAIKRHR